MSVDQQEQTGSFIEIEDVLAVLYKRKWLILAVLLILQATAFIYYFLQTPLYEASSDIAIGYSSLKTIANKGDIYQVPDYQEFQTELFILRSKPIYRKTVKELILLGKMAPVETLEQEEQYVEWLAGMVDISTYEGSNVVNLSARGSDRQFLKDAVNTHIDVYIRERLQARFDTVKKSIDWLKNELTGLQEKVSESERELMDFLDGQDVALLTDYFLVSSANLDDSYTLRSSGTLHTLKQELLQARLDLVNLRQEYLDDHPDIINLRRKITNLQQQLNRESENVRRANKSLIKFQMLKREASLNSNLFNMLTRELKEKDIIGDIPESNISVIQYAGLPGAPVWPNLRQFIIIALMAGLMLSLALSFLLEVMDHSLKSEDDVKLKTGLPLWATVPYVKAAENLPENERYVIDFTGRTVSAEIYRFLRTQLRFAQEPGNAKLTVIASTGTREGKSTVAINLAVALAHAGQKTALVELDMRNPTISKTFGVKAGKSLADYLENKLDETQEICVPSGYDNLDLLPSGPSNENPAELLISSRVAQLFEELRERYDQVVIDTPPMMIVTDTNLIVPHVDGVIMIIKARGETYKTINRAIEQLHIIGAKIYGAVFNIADFDNRELVYSYGRRYGSSRYAYAYAYGKGYGYLDDSTTELSTPPGRIKPEDSDNVVSLKK
jgi:polysaccharide biosynthesis transport protein